ncbi:MAG TPA: complex I subunit 1 family protein, partial [Chloroflexota bacterium]|nr:complex I subunit 1 family protein [Chloroflexota bacterium]
MTHVINDFFPLASGLIFGLLKSFLPDWLASILTTMVSITVFFLFATVVVMSLVFLERRLIAFMQDRLGPNRLGPQGIFQPVADVLKLFAKEDIVPAKADPVVFKLATIVMVVSALLVYAVIPFGPGMIISDLNIGILYVAAVS